MPDVVIIGAQRAGTTSMHTWLCSHPRVARLRHKEVHYFDNNYALGERWYRAHYPIEIQALGMGTSLNVESSPYMLFHPLAPLRAARDLPETTRFLVMLRDPVERAISHYWLERRFGAETETLESALSLEEERLADQFERVEKGERSFRHRHFSYKARGLYAGQLERWFDAVGRERVLVVESERVFVDEAAGVAVLAWLGLDGFAERFPAVNEARRAESAGEGVLKSLESYFAPHNEELFALLGRRMWGQ
jgi:hypothetical protein